MPTPLLHAALLAMLSHTQPADPSAPGRTTPESPIPPSAAGELALARATAADDLADHPLRWAHGAVWYQVFPERFRNGNPLNDPRDPRTYLKDWSSDWYAIDPAEKAAWEKRQLDPESRKRPSPAGGDLYRWIFDRRYGGDLQGIVQKLDELKELGVTALYLNPIFQAQSLHKYDAADFRHIDMNFGWPAEAGKPPALWTPDPEETLDPATWKWTPADRYFIDVFLPECKKRGIRVILDGVWNHVGRDHFAFQDLMRNGRLSPYADWFNVEWDHAGLAVASYKAWDGKNGWLPAFRQTAGGDLVPPVKEHIFHVTRRWMDPNGDGDPSDGIDGWRLDVVPEIPAPFWRDWYALVKQINPSAITIAEIWQDKDRLPQGRYFDTQMNYPFAFPVLDWLTGVNAKGQPMTVSDLHARLDRPFAKKEMWKQLIAQNLFDSHDTDRYVSMLANPGREYDQRNSTFRGDMDYKAGRPTRAVYDLSVLGVAIQATYIGAPMLYYGSEYGMWGADDPDDRKPVPWDDLPPNANPDDRLDRELRSRYATWLNLRRDPELGPVLRFGTVEHLPAGLDDVFAFARTFEGRRALVVVNRGSTPFDAARLGAPTGDSTVGPVDAKVWMVR